VGTARVPGGFLDIENGQTVRWFLFSLVSGCFPFFLHGKVLGKGGEGVCCFVSAVSSAGKEKVFG
jgi:hypothetical protein